VALKDWASIIISLAALGISAGNAFFGVIVQQDDLRVVIGEYPSIWFEEGEARMSGTQELTFINSGNRAAAITMVSGIVSRLPDAESKNPECYKHGELEREPLQTLVSFDTNPFVLKPSEINVMNASLKENIPWKRRKDETFYIPKTLYQPKRGDVFLVCLNFTIVTPDNYLVRWRHPVYKFILIGETDKDSYYEPKQLFPKERPLIILQRTSTVFSRYLR
jgi:hypothetical protein